MFKDMSKTMTQYVWIVTYLRRNVTYYLVCLTTYLYLESILRFEDLVWLLESYISDKQF